MRMFRRTLVITFVLVLLRFFFERWEGRQLRQGGGGAKRQRTSRRKGPRTPVTSFVSDSGGGELIVRLLDIGQGDATYIRNGSSRVIIDGGPDTATFGRYLDSLRLNNSTIDVVILSHEHLDHYGGLRELFKTARHIRVRYFFENKDPAPAVA